MDEKIAINLNIGGRTIRMTIDRDEEEVYREAAKKLNECVNRFYTKFKTADYPTILTIAALQRSLECELIRKEHVETTQQKQTEPFTRKMEYWSDLIDRVTKP